ncbi:MAG: hypothetical protein HY680_10990 [Chloroflexi bacterium]|nr:hypothetical protein [Chloroflexota bacterium]
MPRQKNPDAIAEAKRLWQDRIPQREIAQRLGFGERTVRGWLADEEKPTGKAEPPAPVVTLQELLLFCGDIETARRWQFVLDLAREQGNPLPAVFASFLCEVGDLYMGGIPIVAGWGNWRAATAGFALLGERLGCPTFGEIARVMGETTPWLPKESPKTPVEPLDPPQLRWRRVTTNPRRAYHKAVSPLLPKLHQELMALALTRFTGEPPAYLIEIVKRLPDVDRGGLFQGKVDLAWALLTIFAFRTEKGDSSNG